MATASVPNPDFVQGTASEADKVDANFTALVNFLNNNVIHLDGSKTMTGQLQLFAADPSNPNEAARKAYVDSKIGVQGPAGAIVAYGGTAAPAGWLKCDGAAVSRTTYATLFAAIGTTHGAGDGSTTFNLPDLRGRAPIGEGTGAGLTARVAGTQYGGETQTTGDSNYPTAGSYELVDGGSAHHHSHVSHTHPDSPVMQPSLAVVFIIKT